MKENDVTTISPRNAIFSGHELVIIPVNYKSTPTEDRINECLGILESLFYEHIITYATLDSVQFVDCGQNFESLNCNLCLQEIELDFWHEQMNSSYEKSHFEELDFLTQCCDKLTSLNDLKYDGDCGFSTFYITINNAELNEEKERDLQKLVSETLEMDCKLFWRHL